MKYFLQSVLVLENDLGRDAYTQHCIKSRFDYFSWQK